MFEDDWPGVFIRGDNAYAYASALQLVLMSSPLDTLAYSQVKGLRDLLRSCILPMADQSVIQKIWRGDPPPGPLESPGPSDYIARQEPKE